MTTPSPALEVLTIQLLPIIIERKAGGMAAFWHHSALYWETRFHTAGRLMQ